MIDIAEDTDFTEPCNPRDEDKPDIGVLRFQISVKPLQKCLFNFDSAFLRLYPDFINQFNSLLQEDKQISPENGELLNTDLRIYALVRMGITDSNKIATLLFLSPQTIFNHRTQVRNRAIRRDSFENDVMEICPVISE